MSTEPDNLYPATVRRVDGESVEVEGDDGRAFYARLAPELRGRVQAGDPVLLTAVVMCTVAAVPKR